MAPRAGDTTFREARWRRAGASARQLDELRAAHDERSPDEQTAEGQRVDSVSDVDLAAELTVGDLTDGTEAQVLARVGDDAELAAVALSQEQAKPKPRKGVVEALTAAVEAAHADD